MTVDTRKHMRIIGPLTLVGGIIFAITLLTLLTLRVASEVTPFDTDEAYHAAPALEMDVALRRSDFKHFGQAITSQSFYPPIHSITVLAFYKILGPSLASSRMPGVLMFGVLLGALAVLTYREASRVLPTERFRSGTVLLCTALTLWLASTSPILIRNSVLCMLELLGCVWTTVLLLTCYRFDRASSSCKSRMAFLVSIIVIMTLTKYSFGIIVTPAIVAAMLSDRHPSQVRRSHILEPTVLLLAVSLSISLWFVPARFLHALGFIFSHSSHASFLSMSNIFFYPNAWLEHFSLHPFFSLVTVFLALWGAVRRWGSFSVRAASWIVLCGLIVLTVSLNNCPRHILIAAPAMWFLSGIGLADLLSCLHKSTSRRELQVVVVTAFFGLLFVIVCLRASRLPSELTHAFEGRHGATIGKMQTYIIDNINPEEPVLILGTFDQFNVAMMRWLMAKKSGLAPSEVRVDGSPSRAAFLHVNDANMDSDTASLIRALKALLRVKKNEDADVYSLLRAVKAVLYASNKNVDMATLFRSVKTLLFFSEEHADMALLLGYVKKFMSVSGKNADENTAPLFRFVKSVLMYNGENADTVGMATFIRAAKTLLLFSEKSADMVFLLRTVATTGYYHKVVVIQGPERKRRITETAYETLRKFDRHAEPFGNWVVHMFDLSNMQKKRPDETMINPSQVQYVQLRPFTTGTYVQEPFDIFCKK